MAAYVATHDRSVLPKKYEDTNVCVIQKSTHKDILTVGNNIYQKICDDHEKERNSAVTDLEHRLQTQANEDKQRALKEAKENAEEEMEKAMAAAKKAQEKAVKAESKRMEALMKKLALQQVQQEKDEGEARLTEALEQAKKEFEIEKADVAKKSKAEGIAETQNQIQLILAQEEAKRKKIILNAEREKQDALNALKERLKAEQTKAVQEMQQKCQKQLEQQIQELNEKHQQEIEEMQQKIAKEKNVQDELLVEMARETHKKEQLAKQLTMVKEAFQSFINTTKGFEEGQAEFLIPNLSNVVE